MRKTGRFTHVRTNLHGDVSGKRFNTHVGEGNVADIAQERLSDETGCTDTWHCHIVPSRDNATLALLQGTVTGYRLRIPSQGTSYRAQQQGTDMGLCHLGTVTAQHHSGI